MSWLQQIGGLLQQYAGSGPQQAPPQVEQHFTQVAQMAPPQALAQGIATAFRSDQTPPFPQMVGQLFGQANPSQQAGLLNTMVGAIGPQVAQQFLGGMFQGGISPNQAAQVPPQAVQQLAAHAEQRSPSVIDRVSGFFAQHPTLFSGLGAGALTTALSGMAGMAGGGNVMSASQDPYGDPAGGYGSQQVFAASQDPYGDPADQQAAPASQDPYGDPADQEVPQPAGRW